MAYGLTKSINFAAASTQYATRANTGSTGLNPGSSSFTMEGWIKWSSLPTSGNIVPLWGKHDFIANREYYLYLINAAGVYTADLATSNNGSGSFDVTVANISAPTTGVWIHYAAVYTTSTGTLEFFVNGVSQGTGAGGRTTIFNGTAAFGLGNTGPAEFSPGFDGEMSLVRFWLEARTGTQITTNMCTVLGATTNLSAEWTLDNTYNDNSGNSNTLTGNNTPTFPTDVPSTCVTVVTTAVIPSLMLVGVGM